MEQERLAREKEEEEKKATEAKIKEAFGDANSQWEKDKQEMQDLAAQQRVVPDVKNMPKGQGAAVKAAEAVEQDAKQGEQGDKSDEVGRAEEAVA